MGRRSPWLAYSSAHRRADQTSTLLFIDSPSNPRYPTQWFARNGYAPLVSFALTFDRELDLAEGDELALSHRIAIIDGKWSAERFNELAAELSS